MTQINAAANRAQSKPLNRARTEASCSKYSSFQTCLFPLSWKGTYVGRRTPVERGYKCSLLARSLSLRGWGLIDLPLRASNEGSPRPRVAQAQKIIRLQPLLYSGSTEPIWVSFPPPFYRARSASKKGGLVAAYRRQFRPR